MSSATHAGGPAGRHAASGTSSLAQAASARRYASATSGSVMSNFPAIWSTPSR